MGAFILMDLMSASGSGRGVSNVVLGVFEDEYDIKEFQNRVQVASKNQQNQKEITLNTHLYAAKGERGEARGERGGGDSAQKGGGGGVRFTRRPLCSFHI